MSIDAMIRAAVKCLRCGTQGYGKCNCYRKCDCGLSHYRDEGCRRCDSVQLTRVPGERSSWEAVIRGVRLHVFKKGIHWTYWHDGLSRTAETSLCATKVAALWYGVRRLHRWLDAES